MSEVERILQLIQQRNITAHKLTKDLGLSNSAITDWKKGKAKPSYGAIVKIAEYFNVSTDYLLRKTDDPGPHKLSDADFATKNEKMILSELVREGILPKDRDLTQAELERFLTIAKAFFDSHPPHKD